MTVTQKSDAATQGCVRLRLPIYDALVAARGIRTVKAQAELHGVDRSYMFRLRSGESVPTLTVAMKIAADLGTTVDVLWERVS